MLQPATAGAAAQLVLERVQRWHVLTQGHVGRVVGQPTFGVVKKWVLGLGVVGLVGSAVGGVGKGVACRQAQQGGSRGRWAGQVDWGSRGKSKSWKAGAASDQMQLRGGGRCSQKPG